MAVTHPDFDHVRLDELCRQLELLRIQGGNRPQSRVALVAKWEVRSEHNILFDAGAGSAVGLLWAAQTIQPMYLRKIQEQTAELTHVGELSSAPTVAPV